MKVEELFGTLQQSVVASWRKHLKTDKYSKHEALDEFYKEMPELVDKLIEDWMGVNGKVKEYKNLLDGSAEMTAIEYLKELKKIVKDGYELMEEKELHADLDSIASQIDSTMYKIKELKENMSLANYLKGKTVNEAKALKLDTFVNFDLQSDIYNALSDLAFEYSSNGKKFDKNDVKKSLDWFLKNFFNVDESLNESSKCFTCDKETVKSVMLDLEDEGYDTSIIRDILSGKYKKADELIDEVINGAKSVNSKMLMKFALGINSNPGKYMDYKGTIEVAKKAWNK